MIGPAFSQEQCVIHPFDFQVDCINDVYSLWQNQTQRVLLIAGCGAGKTYMASLIMKTITQKTRYRRRCLFLVDRNNLLEQAADEMTELGVDCSILQGDRLVNWNASVLIVSCGTLESRIRSSGLEAHHVFSQLFGRVDLIVADEAHDVCWRDSYIQLQNYYLPQKTRFLGLTATPWRTKNDEYLGQRFDEAVCAPQPPDLVKIKRI
ncbi:DEAD/DEAH box helicase family protein, partial [Leptolyngbya sp. AN03gr2]